MAETTAAESEIMKTQSSDPEVNNKDGQPTTEANDISTAHQVSPKQKTKSKKSSGTPPTSIAIQQIQEQASNKDEHEPDKSEKKRPIADVRTQQQHKLENAKETRPLIKKIKSATDIRSGNQKPSNIRSIAGANFDAFNMYKNLKEFQGDQRNQPNFIRRLRKKKWMPYCETIITALTIFFITTAWYLHFHVNPTLEMKLTPDFQTSVRDFLSPRNFENCNHSSLVNNKNIANSSIIDDSRCYSQAGYENRYFFETFKTSVHDKTSGCDVDRVEVHPCLVKTKNDTTPYDWLDWRIEGDYYFKNTLGKNELNGSVSPIKFPIMNEHEQKLLFNNTVISYYFFYQCPRCVSSTYDETYISYHRHHHIHHENVPFNRTDYYFNEVFNFQPFGYQECANDSYSWIPVKYINSNATNNE